MFCVNRYALFIFEFFFSSFLLVWVVLNTQVWQKTKISSLTTTLYKKGFEGRCLKTPRRGGFGRFPSTARTTSPIIGRTRPRTARRRVIRNLVATAKKVTPKKEENSLIEKIP
jgi:hypothetical protein